MSLRPGQGPQRLCGVGSASGERGDHRREALGVAYDDMADADVLSKTLQLVDDLLERADQQKRSLLDQIRTDIESLDSLLDLLGGPGAHVCQLDQRRAFDLIEALAGCFGQPGCPQANLIDGEPARRWLTALAVSEASELEDVGVATGNAHDATAVAADQQRYVILGGLHAEVIDREVLVIPVEVGLTSVEQGADGGHGLLEPIDSCARLAQLQTDRIVLGLRVTRAHSEYQPPSRQSIDSRRGSLQQSRVVELVVEHQWPDAQSSRRFRREHQRYEGIDGADVVVGIQLLVPERLGLTCHRDQVIAVGKVAALQGKSKRSDHRPTLRLMIPHVRAHGGHSQQDVTRLPVASGHDRPGSFNGRTSVFGAVYRGSNPLPGTLQPGLEKSDTRATPKSPSNALELSYDSF